jgi:hypothetical protein
MERRSAFRGTAPFSCVQRRRARPKKVMMLSALLGVDCRHPEIMIVERYFLQHQLGGAGDLAREIFSAGLAPRGAQMSLIIGFLSTGARANTAPTSALSSS